MPCPNYSCLRMIKTGDWTIAELIKYLVAVQSTLTPTELDRLKMTAAFPKERGDDGAPPVEGRPPRHKASELYEPLHVLKEVCQIAHELTRLSPNAPSLVQRSSCSNLGCVDILPSGSLSVLLQVMLCPFERRR